MKWLYNAIVKTRILYGVLVWGVAMRHKTMKDKLNKLNYLAVSMISNARKTTPRLTSFGNNVRSPATAFSGHTRSTGSYGEE